MGSRYYITGVQLGMIEAFVEKEPKQVLDLLKEIEDKQYIGDKEYFNKLINTHLTNPTLDVVSRIDGGNSPLDGIMSSDRIPLDISDFKYYVSNPKDILNSKEQKICENNKDCRNCELKECGCRE